jgi:Cu/Ag efflux protein CusF
MRLRIGMLSLLLGLLVFALPFAAAEQFAGEVLKVDVAAKKLTVKKADGNRFSFVVNDKTVFAGSRKSLQDLAKGDSVAVDYSVTGGQYLASKIASQ